MCVVGSVGIRGLGVGVGDGDDGESRCFVFC